MDKSLSIDEAEDLMNLVIELSENEAIIFREVYDNLGNRMHRKHDTFSVKNIVELVPDYNNDIEFYLNRLVGKGLLQEETGAIYRQDGKIYQHTAVGWQLFDAFHGKK